MYRSAGRKVTGWLRREGEKKRIRLHNWGRYTTTPSTHGKEIPLDYHCGRARLKRDNGKIPLLASDLRFNPRPTNGGGGGGWRKFRFRAENSGCRCIYIMCVGTCVDVGVRVCVVYTVYLRPPISLSRSPRPFTSAPKNFIAPEQCTVFIYILQWLRPKRHDDCTECSPKRISPRLRRPRFWTRWYII